MVELTGSYWTNVFMSVFLSIMIFVLRLWAPEMRMGLRHSIILSVSLMVSVVFLPRAFAAAGPYVMLGLCITSLFYGVLKRIWPDVTLSTMMIGGVFGGYMIALIRKLS